MPTLFHPIASSLAQDLIASCLNHYNCLLMIPLYLWRVAQMTCGSVVFHTINFIFGLSQTKGTAIFQSQWNHFY